MALTSKLTARFQAWQTNPLDLGTGQFNVNKSLALDLATGTAANQADKMWSDTRTLAPSGTEDLDLAGVLVDAFGVAVTLARLKGLLVIASAANTNNVNVTRPASNGVPLFLAAGDGLPVLPGGAFEWFAPNAAGIAVTAATADLITITNSGAGTSVTYDVVIIGASS